MDDVHVTAGKLEIWRCDTSRLGTLPLVTTCCAFLYKGLGDWKDDKLCEELLKYRGEDYLPRTTCNLWKHWMDERNPEGIWSTGRYSGISGETTCWEGKIYEGRGWASYVQLVCWRNWSFVYWHDWKICSKYPSFMGRLCNENINRWNVFGWPWSFYHSSTYRTYFLEHLSRHSQQHPILTSFVPLGHWSEVGDYWWAICSQSLLTSSWMIMSIAVLKLMTASTNTWWSTLNHAPLKIQIMWIPLDHRSRLPHPKMQLETYLLASMHLETYHQVRDQTEAKEEDVEDM